jgi:hypothetical protein
MKKDDNCEVNFLDKIFCKGITFATFYSDRGMRSLKEEEGVWGP